MDILSKRPFIEPGTPPKKLAYMIGCTIGTLIATTAISYGYIYKFFETVELLKLVDKGEIFFFEEAGYTLGLILCITPMLSFAIMILPTFINRRFNSSISLGVLLIGLLVFPIGLILAPISNFIVESYIESQGYEECYYYSTRRGGRGFPPDYYVFDSKYCVSAVSKLRNKAFPWFEEANKKGEVDYDEFLLKVEQWKAESRRLNK
ncbi:hypothetical protein EXT46_16705 [Pseudoalteromonas sp. CO325X]|uniref:hypothetical protein n=1 Tax=Pseudoalteromonas sp. CO325X TaxID=1777262 RepID=UPI001022B4A1|nr:hypothetical protein [Pseudoalteromonas sp. CO325X]RZF77764.1 hypothetical protein EXT46_16705 [Pseudoalteromonas sp. CO325X]